METINYLEVARLRRNAALRSLERRQKDLFHIGYHRMPSRRQTVGIVFQTQRKAANDNGSIALPKAA
jgi:ABC-type ATPase involved in cell division